MSSARFIALGYKSFPINTRCWFQVLRPRRKKRMYKRPGPLRFYDCRRRCTSERGNNIVVMEHLSSGAIDAKMERFHYGPMSLTLEASPRRSTRVFHKMRVQVKGRSHSGRKFTETCQTLVVNAHGGLLLLKQEVNDGEMLVLI